MDLTTDDIQIALDEITELHSLSNGFISVEFTQDEKLVVRYRELDYKISSAPEEIELTSSESGKTYKIPVEYEAGPEIIPSFGDVEIHKPYESPEALAGEMGGDECRNANSMNYYGTISFYAGGIELEASGRCRKRCGASPALMSNNHVIGRSDSGRKGEVIWTRFRADTARLECLLPFSCRGDVDVAIAKVGNISGISKWTVRTIGKLNGIRRPRIGESIQKHGARTGYTTGSVTGQTNIRVGSHTFRRVFSTSGGFSCPGDSGSSVVASNKDVIGILSWGDKVPCSSNPRGYFWTLINPGTLSDDSETSLVNVDIPEK
jgi:hypothetical protein